MKKVSAVYKITNKITGECYVGSSVDVYKRWKAHKCPSSWKAHPNNRMYQDMQKYGVDQFEFEIIVPAATTHLKVCEQEFIDIYNPTYNNRKANVGIDTTDMIEYMRQYDARRKTERVEYMRQYYQQHKDEIAEYKKQYYQQHKDEIAEYKKQHKTK